MLNELYLTDGEPTSQIVHIRSFFMIFHSESLHPRVCLYNFWGVLVALSDEELISESELIQLPGGFGCAFRRESYIQEFAYSISEEPKVRLRLKSLHEGFGVRLQKESLHPRVCLCPIKRNLFLIKLLKGKCRCFYLVILTCSTHRNGNKYSKHSGFYMRPP